MAVLLSNHKINKLNRRYSLSLLKKSNFDLLHSTYYNPYFLGRLKRPFVLTVHDMIHEIFPRYFDEKDEAIMFKKNIVEKASHIIAISGSTKRDLQRFLHVPEEKISVVHHGYHLQQADLNFAPPFSRYILFVGDRRAYKNFDNFILGAAPVLKKMGGINIICTGGGSFSTQELGLLSELELTGRAQQLSVSDARLSTLYRNASALVFPSLYEGFGFPLLEAFQNRCPVACSNTSSFPEVGGDAVVYFDPGSAQEIQLAIEKIITDTDFADQLREKGTRQLQKFTMEKCIEHTREVYKKVLGKN
jgi:glycosyltransferase involved in cell wall biosynthesis